MQAKVLSNNDQHVAELNKTFQKISDMVTECKKIVLDESIKSLKVLYLLYKNNKMTLLHLKNVTECRDFTSNTLHN